MKSLEEDFKTGQLKHLYLLYGEEAYLRRQYKEKLKNALVAPDDAMNYAYFEGKDVPVKGVIDLAETLPFFAERRLILLENTSFFETASEELADYMSQIPESTYFVFVESKVDKRGRLYKAVQKHGRAVELSRQEEATLLRWILGRIKREGKQISEKTLRTFLSKVGNDMENIERELEKLFCYTLEKAEITTEDVDAICTTQITNRIFDMVDAVAVGKSKLALDYYYDLLELREPPMRILFLLIRQFKILLEVKDLSVRGFGRKEIAEKAGVPPFAVGKYQQQAQAFSAKELRAALEEGAETEEKVKTGNLTDTLGVELFIVKHSRRKSG